MTVVGGSIPSDRHALGSEHCWLNCQTIRGVTFCSRPTLVGPLAKGQVSSTPFRKLAFPTPFTTSTRSSTSRWRVSSLESALRVHDAAVVVLIHYFGRPSAMAGAAAELARQHGAMVVEDEAHAWLSDLVGGICGRLGHASLFSLHKLLAVPDGGLLVVEHGLKVASHGDDPATALSRALGILGGDLHEIARRRRTNLAALAEALPELAENITPVWSNWPVGVVPQSFPIIVRHHDRDALYHMMNARGVGVVSLYHTLIEPLRSGEFPVPLALSRRIMNLPLHQGVTPSHMREVVEQLGDVLRTAPLRK
jgi:dTDP-4-amino-4,6-dideoxygalactose transaminase